MGLFVDGIIGDVGDVVMLCVRQGDAVVNVDLPDFIPTAGTHAIKYNQKNPWKSVVSVKTCGKKTPTMKDGINDSYSKGLLTTLLNSSC